MSALDDALAAIDAGLQHTGETDYYPELRDKRCWRCDKDLPTNHLGLCKICDEWLHEDQVIGHPDSASLHPHGTLPEEIPDAPTVAPSARIRDLTRQALIAAGYNPADFAPCIDPR